MRYYPNPFITDPDRESNFNGAAAWGLVQSLLPALEQALIAHAIPTSTGHSDPGNLTVYTGLGGVGLAFLRLGLHHKAIREDKDATKVYLRKALECATLCMEQQPESREVAFYCGTPGNIAIAAAASDALGDHEGSAILLKKLLTWCDAACHPATIGRSSTDEMLFGRAGFIYALLWVRKHTSDTKLRLQFQLCVATSSRDDSAQRAWSGPE